MLADASLPDGLKLPATQSRKSGGVELRSVRWAPATLGELTRGLAREGPDALASISTRDLRDAWAATVGEFRDPGSAARTALAAPLAELAQLSAEGLAAGLEAVLGGVAGPAADAVFAEAERMERGERSPVLVILASNLPALAVQPLLPALALRRPVLLKSPSSEPLFAPAFVDALCRREPRLRPALAAVTWPGGDEVLEQPVLAAVGRVVAYGGGAAMRDLARRAAGKLLAYGPKLSLAAIAADVAPTEVAAGLARDIALFDQRGCLSVQAVYTAGEPRALARALAAELDVLAERWPAGPADPEVAAAVRQMRAEAEMRGLYQPALGMLQGTVVVESEPALQLSPGLRTVRVHGLASLVELPTLLEPWAGRLQGVALAGADARSLEPALRGLGVSRLAPPGQLQSPDAGWHNGGVSPLAALAS